MEIDMKIVFYGAGKWGKKALELLQSDEKAARSFIGYADSNKTGLYCGYPILTIEQLPEDTVIVITIAKSSFAVDIYYLLRKYGFYDLYCFVNREKKSLVHNFLEDNCISCKTWGDCVLGQVEMHVVDFCNLNCKGCTHFSPIFKKIIPDTVSRINDIKVLNGKFSYIFNFFLLGGEPLLNPDIIAYLDSARKILPHTNITIVTNGLLLPSLKEEVFEHVRSNDIVLSISEYEPTHRMLPRIIEKLEQESVFYEIRQHKETFSKPLSLTAHSKYPHRCISDGCVNILDGKIARCPTLMYIDEFNQKFGMNLPNEGILELKNAPSGRNLLDYLKQEVPLCRHCIAYDTTWERCGMNPQVEDFAVDE